MRRMWFRERQRPSSWMRVKHRFRRGLTSRAKIWNKLNTKTVKELPRNCYLTQEILYDPATEMTPALREFRDRAAGIGLCWDVLEPSAVPVPVPNPAVR